MNQIEDPLAILRSWNDSLHFCDWYGIKCDRQNQRVISLKLVGLNLVGPIFPSIANLTFLEEFNLRNNRFHGEISQEIGRLSQLQTLNLSRNFFQGEIPTNLTHCTQLKTIDLNHNELVGKIHSEFLISLSKLRILYLGYNNLTGSIPPSVGNLSSLTDCCAQNRHNNLEGRIPDELGRIAGLEYLQIGSNELSGMIPTTLYNLSSLLLFDVTGNQLFGSLPPHLGLTLSSLQYLYVGQNQFTGPIPVSLSNASGLIELEFSGNNFDGSLPLNLGNIQSLQYLNLGSNQLGTKGGDDLGFLTSLTNCSNLDFLDAVLNNLNGALPSSVAILSINLSHLSLGGNQIFGSIPVGIENLLSLTALGMDNNILTGAIPIGIGKLTRLEGLYLSRNRLSGQIPSSFGNLTRLNELYLYQNYLQGIIPSTLEKCQYLQVIELSDNNFTGTIPVQVLSLPSLSNSLNLSRNSFIGSLPSDFDLKFLQRLDISDNKLLGEIPLALGNCLSLEYLYMGGNFFQGSIPQSLKNLEGIKELDLSHNNLSGPFPKYLENFTNLNYLNLSFNDLGGEVPKEGIFKNKTAISVLGNSKLCGGIQNLMLPACPNQDTKKQRNSLALRVILPVTGALVCLILISCFLVVLYWKRKSGKKHIPTSFNADRHLKISYAELLNATNSFSSTNLIGSGSFGSVYKGIIDHNETIVAVKVLNLQQRGASKSFLAECEAMRNIRHRNLVKIITSCSSIDFKGNDFKALVLEFMPNGSLEMWLHPKGGERQSKDLTLTQRLDIAIDVASALDYLHHHCQPPIVHRDLKPNNVLLDDDLNARVADFGLAVFLNEASSNLSGNQNSSIEIKGSIGYLAPEYGMGGKASIHGDVYSYGILLLEMFIGKRPTDDMFHNNLSLHQFAKMAIAEQVMEIIDPQLLLGEIGDERNNSYISRECLVSLVRIGVSCSIESPAERMDMRDVVIALNEIKDLYLGVGIYEDRQTRGQFLLEDSSYLRNYCISKFYRKEDALQNWEANLKKKTDTLCYHISKMPSPKREPDQEMLEEANNIRLMEPELRGLLKHHHQETSSPAAITEENRKEDERKLKTSTAFVAIFLKGREGYDHVSLNMMEFFNVSSRYGDFCSFLILVTLFFHTHFILSLESAPTPTNLLLANETDRHALLDFKNQIGDPLAILSSWNDSLHFCNWYGIKCDLQNQRVISLKLVGLNLVGSISPYIANLTFLTEFNLRNNEFHGEIPQEISRLTQLQTLNLSRNSFQGEIPTNLSHCTQLKTIDLNHNELVGEIPAGALTSLSNLHILYLGYNNLTGNIPPSVGNLSSLTDLYLSNNNLEGRIPDELGLIAGLKYLQVGSNELSGMIPITLYNLSSLVLLDVMGNQLSGNLPPDLGLTLSSLQYLYVGVNQFTGPIPVSLSNASGLIEVEFSGNNFDGSLPLNLGNIKSLQYLNLGRNQLGSEGGDDLGFLTSLTNCSNLDFLDLVLNNLNGSLPSSIANLSINLSHLSLGGNQIFGSIAVGIENLVSLTVLGMDNNFLTGAIPAGIGKLNKLEGLYLSRNRLHGQIPSSFGNLTRLNELYLYQNYLQGIIPTLEKCQYLQVLELSDNNLTGTIPVQILSLPSLSNCLNLSRNSLIGSLPSGVDLKFLQRFDISHNKLLGEIPLSLGNCLSLEYLYMGGNFFQGTIPQSLRNLEGIQELDLSCNNLSGQIPNYLEKCTNLHYLNLSFNDLEGEVPKEGIFKNTSAISILGNNKLCGGIQNLMLLACPNQSTKKQGNSLALRVIIPVTGAVLCLILILCFFAVFYWKRKSRKKLVPSTTLMEDHHLKVSYAELLNATDGFSSTNLIGLGSFGTVYKGILDHDKTIVAVKVLNLQQQGASQSFMAECEAMRNIRHRNLVKIITCCSSIDFKGNDFKALVLEFMSNGSLEMWLHPNGGEHQSKDLTLIQRLDIAIDVASALDYLHHHCQPPIVHRDLKPNNVLLDDDMNAHVADFGLAIFLKEASNNVSRNQNTSMEIKGSIGYLAPEYGMGGKASMHGDVYSYGIFLLEMFTGKRPTDDMFHNNLSLHQFAKMALPERVMEIIDPQLLLGEIDNEGNNSYISRECLVSLVRIGVSCSVESPFKRMDMRDVVLALNEIKDLYLGVGISEDRQIRAQFLLEESSYLSNYY
ncbi:uncharacterized protein LOC143847891 [Tasmannia lanceolata]|uniref:uncharacterized protein LOC143847891 n=1 Tax=Tasmannia lanceolata TaxID=3420 RepID=UPI004064C076